MERNLEVLEHALAKKEKEINKLKKEIDFYKSLLETERCETNKWKVERTKYKQLAVETIKSTSSSVKFLIETIDNLTENLPIFAEIYQIKEVDLLQKLTSKNGLQKNLGELSKSITLKQ